MEQIRSFISQVSTGQAAEAKQTLNDMISSRALDALQAKKQEMASNVFNGQQESQEETAIEQSE